MHGGIEAACLNPVHDKLRALQEKLGRLEGGDECATHSVKTETEDPLPRLTKKRARNPDLTDEENDEAAVADGNAMDQTYTTHHEIIKHIQQYSHKWKRHSFCIHATREYRHCDRRGEAACRLSNEEAGLRCQG